MSNLNNTVKKDDLDELTAMLQLLDEPEKLASEAVVGDEIDDLLADLNDETIVPVPAVAETVMEAKDGGDLSGVFEELENEHESLKVVDVEIPQVESISPLPEIDSTQGDKPQTDEKKEKHAKESSVAAQPKESKAAKKERAASRTFLHHCICHFPHLICFQTLMENQYTSCIFITLCFCFAKFIDHMQKSAFQTKILILKSFYSSCCFFCFGRKLHRNLMILFINHGKIVHNSFSADHCDSYTFPEVFYSKNLYCTNLSCMCHMGSTTGTEI